MAITSKGKKITLKAVIYEDEVLELREQLNKLAPKEITFDLSDCDDVHLSIIQQMLAYKKLHSCTFKFSSTPKVYQKLIEGFDVNDCSL